MPQPFLNIDATELLRLEHSIPELRGMSEDLSEEWRALVPGITKTISARFQREGPGWKQLARSTQLQRRREGFGAAHPILVRTGDLRESFLDGSTQIIEPDWMYYASPHEWAGVHQHGSKDGRIPARPIIVPEEHEDAIQRAFEDAFVERANKLWDKATGRGQSQRRLPFGGTM